MPHIDEGSLHALLDGALSAEEPERAAAVRAHLAACPDCRARFDEAAELRDRAGEVLAAAQPTALRPDFQDVLRRRHPAEGDDAADATDFVSGRPTSASAAAARAGLYRTRRLAWAASVVLALGTGYLIGDRFGLVDSASREAASAALREAAPEAERTAAESVVEDAEAGHVTADGVTAGSADRSMERFGPARPATAADGTGEDRTYAEARPEPEPFSARLEAPVRSAGEEAVALRGGAARDEAAGGEAAGAAAAEDAPPMPGPPSPRAAGRLEALRMQGALEAGDVAPVAEETEAGAGVTGVQAVGYAKTAADRVAERWETATAAEAARALDGPLLRVPDGTIEEVAVQRSGEGTRVRTRQMLPYGVVVVVVQSPAGDRPDTARTAAALPATNALVEVAEAAGSDTRSVVVAREGYMLVISGSLPRELLMSLGEDAEPVQ